jgi:hypothetical protein
MQWSSGDRGNIEDRRGGSMRTAVPISVGGVIVLGLLSWVTGTDFLSLLSDQSEPQSIESDGPVRSSPQEERKVDFVDAVAGDVQNTFEQEVGSRADQGRAVPRCHRIGVRLGRIGDRSVLLSGR